MKLETTNIPGLVIITNDIHHDERGYFIEQFQKVKLSELGFDAQFNPEQINLVKNLHAGTLRGLHAEPWDKFVTVIKGKVFAAWVDLRNNSKDFYSLTIQPGTSVYIPRGVANSYQTLEDDTYYMYAVNGHWHPEQKYIGINPFDPTLNIEWPISKEQSIVSAKDLNLPGVSEI